MSKFQSFICQKQHFKNSKFQTRKCHFELPSSTNSKMSYTRFRGFKVFKMLDPRIFQHNMSESCLVFSFSFIVLTNNIRDPNSHLWAKFANFQNNQKSYWKPLPSINKPFSTNNKPYKPSN